MQVRKLAWVRAVRARQQGNCAQADERPPPRKKLLPPLQHPSGIDHDLALPRTRWPAHLPEVGKAKAVAAVHSAARMRLAVLACLVASLSTPRLAGGFAVTPSLHGAPRGAAARVPASRAAAPLRLRAVLDKAASAAASALNNIPLPTSPRIQDFDGGEVQSSLDRFIKSAPEGLMRTGKMVGDKVLPAAAEMANDMLFKDYNKQNMTVGASAPAVREDNALPAGWAEHTDEETGRTFYFEVATATAVWERPRSVFTHNTRGVSSCGCSARGFASCGRQPFACAG
jgi:hypothetical protein